jgi:hypothetical protein
VYTLQGHELHLNVYRQQEALLSLDVSTLQEGPELHLKVSTLQGPELHLNVSTLQGHELQLDVSGQQEPLLLLFLSTYRDLS